MSMIMPTNPGIIPWIAIITTLTMSLAIRILLLVIRSVDTVDIALTRKALHLDSL